MSAGPYLPKDVEGILEPQSTVQEEERHKEQAGECRGSIEGLEGILMSYVPTIVAVRHTEVANHQDLREIPSFYVGKKKKPGHIEEAECGLYKQANDEEGPFHRTIVSGISVIRKVDSRF